MDRVVAAEAVLGGKVACGACEWLVDADDVQLVVEALQRDLRRAVSGRADDAAALGRGQGGTGLGVEELAGDEEVGSVPQLAGRV